MALLLNLDINIVEIHEIIKNVMYFGKRGITISSVIDHDGNQSLPLSQAKFLTFSPVKGSPCRTPATRTNYDLNHTQKNQLYDFDTQHITQKKKLTLISTPAGRMIGLNERECGQTGVTKMAATLG